MGGLLETQIREVALIAFAGHARGWTIYEANQAAYSARMFKSSDRKAHEMLGLV